MYRTADSEGNVKYTGRSTAIVLDNRDPLNKGRIIVDHALLGNTVWIDYLRVPGVFSVPSISDVVYIECDSGEYEFPFAWGNKTKGEDAAPEIPEKFKRTVPTNRGFYSPGGHFIEMDDGVAPVTDAPQDKNYTTQSRGIRITSAANNKIHIVEDTILGNQYILIQDAGGNLIKLDYKNNELTVNSIGKTNISTAQDKTETVGANDNLSVTGNKSEDISGNLTINVSGNVNVTAGGNAIVQASEIHLNGAAGNILTTVTDPIIDTIFGIQTIGVPTVKSG